MANETRRNLGTPRMEGEAAEERMPDDWFKEGSSSNEFEEGDVIATTGSGGMITLRDLQNGQEKRHVAGPSGRTVRSGPNSIR